MRHLDALVPASSASLRTELELAQAEVRSLRGERDKLKAALQRNLGHQLDRAGNAELVARIDELTAISRQLTVERDALRGEKADLEKRLEEAHDDLAAARMSLRDRIRRENT
ncbi:hypothetical protein [Streptomyces iconiensis]|uniref:Uncharacterized protein n=1 Tax=Streptomyces iconiensis TaxID=1384038 RepID=A0ABT6ZXZ1_9ACTN|nr:hypothetical protein [Streptomyces iconiensis]MDJ1133936.1 hypothetical protein [Streptomyces iconiensis]